MPAWIIFQILCSRDDGSALTNCFSYLIRADYNMASPGDDLTSILFRGVRLTLHANLPFTYSADGTLIIHCCNFTGDLTLQYGKYLTANAACLDRNPDRFKN